MINNYISIKVCGNPEGVGGIQPIAASNETETVNIIDDSLANSGFCQGNGFSYWFKIKIEAQRTIYTLGTHKVTQSGIGSNRDGRLYIAIAIPRGHKLSDNKNPYDVLIELKDYFLSKYMTSTTSIAGTYYKYNSEPIPMTALDEIAKGYTVVPHVGPHRPMIGSAIGYVIIPTYQGIKDLMSDVQYPEFTNFSEVIIANSGSRIGCTPINGLLFPRRTVFKVMENGKEICRANNVNERVSINGVQNHEYYENITEDFTITELREGAMATGVIGLDEENEIVNVNRDALSKPRVKTLFLNVTGDQLGLVTGKDFEVKHNNIPIPVSENGSIKLEGRQLAFLREPEKFNITCRGKRVSGIVVDGDSIRGNIITNTPPVCSGTKGIGVSTPASNTNFKLFKILLPQSVRFDGTTLRLQDANILKYYIASKEGDEVVVWQMFKFETLKQNNNKYELLVAIPKHFEGKHIKFRVDNYLSKGIALTGNGEITELAISNGDFEKRAPQNDGNLLKIMCIALAALFLGACVGGYVGYSFMKEKAPAFECGDCKGKFSSQEDLQNHCDVHAKQHEAKDAAAKEAEAKKNDTKVQTAQKREMKRGVAEANKNTSSASKKTQTNNSVVAQQLDACSERDN